MTIGVPGHKPGYRSGTNLCASCKLRRFKVVRGTTPLCEVCARREDKKARFKP